MCAADTNPVLLSIRHEPHVERVRSVWLRCLERVPTATRQRRVRRQHRPLRGVWRVHTKVPMVATECVCVCVCVCARAHARARTSVVNVMRSRQQLTMAEMRDDEMAKVEFSELCKWLLFIQRARSLACNTKTKNNARCVELKWLVPRSVKRFARRELARVGLPRRHTPRSTARCVQFWVLPPTCKCQPWHKGYGGSECGLRANLVMKNQPRPCEVYENMIMIVCGG